MVENPDKVIVLEVDTCSCGQSLDKIDSSKVIKRQSFDLPKIKMMVTQFEQHTKVCPCCNTINTKAFPECVRTTTPPDTINKKTRGKTAQAKGKNLLDRFVKHKEEVLRFCTDFSVPFTNNLTERDLRMIKVKEKISGTFASFKGGEIFARIRGYISTVKKNNRPVLEELSNVLKGKPYMPCGIVC